MLEVLNNDLVMYVDRERIMVNLDQVGVYSLVSEAGLLKNRKTNIATRIHRVTVPLGDQNVSKRNRCARHRCC